MTFKGLLQPKPFHDSFVCSPLGLLSSKYSSVLVSSKFSSIFQAEVFLLAPGDGPVSALVSASHHYLP